MWLNNNTWHIVCFGGLEVYVATLLLEECEDNAHTPEMGIWESIETLKISEFDYRGQNTLHWGVFYIIGKLSKCRCRKWAHMSHLDICSISYGKKKSREVKLAIWLSSTKSQESTRPRCVQVVCDTLLESSWQKLQVCFRLHLSWRSE